MPMPVSTVVWCVTCWFLLAGWFAEGGLGAAVSDPGNCPVHCQADDDWHDECCKK